MDDQVIARFWAKVDRGGDDECWPWTGCMIRGYGQFAVGNGKRVRAPRFAYEILVGPIPHGLVIDHLCRNTSCVNPSHLEPVTSRENTLRGIGPSALHAGKRYCKRGHEFTPENTYRTPRGRQCRECKVFLLRQWRARQRDAA